MACYLPFQMHYSILHRKFLRIDRQECEWKEVYYFHQLRKEDHQDRFYHQMNHFSYQYPNCPFQLRWYPKLVLDYVDLPNRFGQQREL